MRAAGISRNHQAIPGRDDLVVEMRPRPFGTNGKQFLATLRRGTPNFSLGFPKVLRGLCDRMALNQNIFAAEFILRIAPFRRISMGLHAIMKIENLGDIPQRSIDFLFVQT